jgi:hypothetical protein
MAEEQEVREIRLNLKEAPRLAKVLQLKMQGYTNYRIADKLDMTETGVKRDLYRIERDYPNIVKFLKTIQKVGYFARKRQKEASQRAISIIPELLSKGIPLPVGNVAGARHIGYKHVGNRIEVDDVTAPLAKEIFETYYNSGNFKQFCKKHDLNPISTRRMMKNPIYIGKVIYKGKEYSFSQLAIIDEEIWRACQPYKKPVRWIGFRAPFGFIRRAGRLLKDPEKAPTVLQVVELRFDKKSMAKIAKTTQLTEDKVFRILNNPIYAGKVLVDGKYVDAGVEKIVEFDKWWKAHTIIKDDRYLPSRETARANKKKRLEELLDWIKHHQGLRWTEIKAGMRFSSKEPISPASLNKYLWYLKLENKIEKREGRWYTKDSSVAPS